MIMTKIYDICSDLDFEKVAVAALKMVYSVTLFPRVVSTIQNSVLAKNFAKNIDFECFFTQKYANFAKKVHFDYFDLGIFFFQNSKKTKLKLVDGNGLSANSFVTNIFDYVFSLDQNELKNYKEHVIKQYQSLDKSKLLVQKFD